MRASTITSCLLGTLLCTFALANTLSADVRGVLDAPLPQSNTAVNISTSETSAPVAEAIQNVAGNSEAVQEVLREELENEQEVLEALPQNELEDRAEQGERAAQVTLAESFAEEATMLSFAPAAANDALSDAVRWYSLAAQRGFPGAPSLDQAGVKFFPIRVQRTR